MLEGERGAVCLKMKLVALATVAIVLCALPLIPQLLVSGMQTVEVAPVTRQQYAESITAGGKIYAQDLSEVYFDFPIIAEEIYVRPGDPVSAGQRLFTVNKEATVEMILNVLTGNSSLPVYLSNDKIMSVLGALGADLTSLADLIDSDSLPGAVYAPAGGVVAAMAVSRSEINDPTKPAVSIARNDALIARVQVDEAFIKEVRVGNKVRLTGPGFREKEYWGAVTRIDDSAKTVFSGLESSTMIEVEIAINRPDDSIKNGFSARAQIYPTEEQTVTVVPYRAVRQDERGAEYVYVARGYAAECRVIETGRELEQGFEVKAGLRAGESVVLDPPEGHPLAERIIPKRSNK